jgi:hypothetical protein
MKSWRGVSSPGEQCLLFALKLLHQWVYSVELRGLFGLEDNIIRCPPDAPGSDGG